MALAHMVMMLGSGYVRHAEMFAYAGGWEDWAAQAPDDVRKERDACHHLHEASRVFEKNGDRLKRMYRI